MDEKNPTILVVEDEIPLLEAIRIKMEKNGLMVLSARSVEQALNHLKDVEGIRAIWLDHYLLGKETGIDFVMKCKAEESPFKNIPIFVISNTASPDKVQAYLQLGINQYYVKAEKRLDKIIEEIKNSLQVS
jgi:DNA-binding NtrC family response regulator